MGDTYRSAKQSSGRNLRGFTIVELLIVIVVIAILSAITVFSYLGITNAAHDASVTAELDKLSKAVAVATATDELPTPLGGDYGNNVSSRDMQEWLNSHVKPGEAEISTGEKFTFVTTPIQGDDGALLGFNFAAISKSGKVFVTRGAAKIQHIADWSEAIPLFQERVDFWQQAIDNYAIQQPSWVTLEELERSKRDAIAELQQVELKGSSNKGLWHITTEADDTLQEMGLVMIKTAMTPLGCSGIFFFDPIENYWYKNANDSTLCS